MEKSPSPGVCRIALLAPVIFAAHVAEEAPGFVGWANRLLEEDITQELFVSVNTGGFVVTTVLAIVVALSRSRAAIVLMVWWLSFLMLGNAILHVVATMVLGRYSPGVVTSIILYLPFFFVFLRRALRQFGIRFASAAAAVVAGALPMLVHGYLIVFRGSRLF